MKRFTLALRVLMLFSMAGYGETIPDSETGYSSDTSSEDCCLYGGGIENLIPSYWGQNNVALISLNTYDRLSGRMIEEYAGIVLFGGGGSTDGGFSANLLLDYDRGYATGSVDFLNDEKLDADKVAAFLCADCLNEILPQKINRCFGVGAIHLGTKEICLFDETLSGFAFIVIRN